MIRNIKYRKEKTTGWKTTQLVFKLYIFLTSIKIFVLEHRVNDATFILGSSTFLYYAIIL